MWIVKPSSTPVVAGVGSASLLPIGIAWRFSPSAFSYSLGVCTAPDLAESRREGRGLFVDRTDGRKEGAACFDEFAAALEAHVDAAFRIEKHADFVFCLIDVHEVGFDRFGRDFFCIRAFGLAS